MLLLKKVFKKVCILIIEVLFVKLCSLEYKMCIMLVHLDKHRCKRLQMRFMDILWIKDNIQIYDLQNTYGRNQLNLSYY